ncbi:XRN_N domain-containing protein [Caerostris extrusa]|uniref:XRN_N domain-containing protein n=1 Tax=Caerostris extrusa TaxID=172846 RepID=A0AAV4X601_CAEEX|nr:XRN_N domain-containing protein [Caerostris extrusa]
MMAYVMYACANAKPFELDTKLNVTTVKDDGVEAHEFFASHKVWMIGPTGINTRHVYCWFIRKSTVNLPTSHRRNKTWTFERRMGINNFCKLIDPVLSPQAAPEHFDSILVDFQSFLYIAIEKGLEPEESAFFRELCQCAWHQFLKTINSILSFAKNPEISLVIAFDGEGVPMKWPTQRQRRSATRVVQGKNIYRFALFSVNTISLRVQRYIIERLKRYPIPPNINRLNVVVCGCNVPGEGEHKLFHVAESIQVRHPIVVSVDQDVRLIHTSFLFGNDFIPSLVGITPINAPTIHTKLSFEDSEESNSDSDNEEEGDTLNPAHVIARFLHAMERHLRFERVPHVDDRLLEAFWMTFCWMTDYYTKREYPQKYLENPIYDAFDRNQLLTGLWNAEYSAKILEKVQNHYTTLVTQPRNNVESTRAVFTNVEVLETLKPYWTEPNDESCTRLQLTKRIPSRK